MSSANSPNNPQGWPALVGGSLLNVALGTYYAWSVFVPALEREFHWSRTQTSLVPTIGAVMIASMFLVAGFRAAAHWTAQRSHHRRRPFQSRTAAGQLDTVPARALSSLGD